MSFTFSLDQSYFLSRQNFPQILPTTTDGISDFIKITCFPEWYSHITLSWNIPSSWGNCKFNVYFAQGGTNSYLRLNDELLSNPFFKDLTSKEYRKFSNGHYVVEVIFPNNTTTVRSKPVFAEYNRREKIDKIALEIQRREYMLLSKFAGIKSFLFRKKAYGDRCPRCWNPSLEKVMDDHCEVCFGTSWEGGYFDPIPLFIQYEVTPSAKIKGYSGDIEPNSIGGWTISMPEIYPEDVIIRTGSFNVYKVINLSCTELQTKVVRQLITLTQLSRNDVENKLTNKVQLDSSLQPMQELGGVYRNKRFPTNLLDKNRNNDFEWAKAQNLTDLPKYDI